MGGSLAHADPAAELPAVMVALDAEVVLQSAGGERRLRAGDFFTGLFQTALEPGELIVAVLVPAQPAKTGSAFEEFSRRHGDYALAGVAVTVTLGPQGKCASARIALLSVGEGPVLATGAMEELRGRDLGDQAIAAAAARVAQEIDPPSDIHASSAYRRQLARVLTRRALSRATVRAQGGTA
jgi:carbon-monoxide dehydrogenase medium subunit